MKIQTKFEGIIFTADESGAGTDARVEIWFTDNDGQVVGPLMITEVNGDTMERGHQNNITVELVEELNGLSKIQLKQVSWSFVSKSLTVNWRAAKVLHPTGNLKRLFSIKSMWKLTNQLASQWIFTLTTGSRRAKFTTSHYPRKSLKLNTMNTY